MDDDGEKIALFIPEIRTKTVNFANKADDWCCKTAAFCPLSINIKKYKAMCRVCTTFIAITHWQLLIKDYRLYSSIYAFLPSQMASSPSPHPLRQIRYIDYGRNNDKVNPILLFILSFNDHPPASNELFSTHYHLLNIAFECIANHPKERHMVTDNVII